MGPDEKTKKSPKKKLVADSPSFYGKPGNRPGPAASSAGSAAAAAAAAPPARPGQGMPGPARPGQSLPGGALPPPARPGQSMPGGSSPSIPGQARSGVGAPKPSPAAAAAFRQGQKTGARKVASKALKTSERPKPRPKAEAQKTGIAGILQRNKGNNERLAKERQNKAARKG